MLDVASTLERFECGWPFGLASVGFRGADDSASRREALAWLRGQLARSKFDVAIVGAAQHPDDAVAKAARSITAGDSVLVHVSGRLLGAHGLAFGGGRSASLRQLPEAFAARRPADLSFAGRLDVRE